MAKDFAKEQELVEASVRKPPPPDAFRGLRISPDMSFEYEEQEGTVITASDEMLRVLSPFVLRVEPPIIYGRDGGFLAASTNNVNLNVFAKASQTFSSYTEARKAIAQSGMVSLDSLADSVEEFVVKNSRSGSNRNMDAVGRPLNSDGYGTSRLGEPAIADTYSAIDIAWQLNTILKTPPLTLLINPTTFNKTFTKIQQYQDRTRYGYVHHAWGEEQVRMQITAKCGAFMAGGKGVQYASKRDSASWQNLMGLFHIYQNSGYIYNTVDGSYANHAVGSVSIHYDQWVYYGHMENLSFSYDESTQLGGIEFSIDFVVSESFDTSQSSFAVLPMKSPNPGPEDWRYMNDPPNTWSGSDKNSRWGFKYSGGWDSATRGPLRGNSDGTPLSGSNLGSFGGVRNPSSQGAGNQEVGDDGFQDGDTQSVGGRAVSQSFSGEAKPFGF